MIELHTSATPNGHKASVTLEELELDYEVYPINLGKAEQKTLEFLALNPNGAYLSLKIARMTMLSLSPALS